MFEQGRAPDSFLTEQIAWGRSAPDDIFAPNAVTTTADVYNKVFAELGPWTSLLHRKAVMLEVQRVLAGFESSWSFTEGVDTSRLGDDTPENSEAGAWQVSYDARDNRPDLILLLAKHNIDNGVAFQRAMKFDHPLAFEFSARLMRGNTKHNGPLYKGDERLKIRSSLRGQVHSIYPWLSRASVAEFQTLLKG